MRLPLIQTEPYEYVLIDVDEEHSGMVIERMALRKGEMDEFQQIGAGKVRYIPRSVITMSMRDVRLQIGAVWLIRSVDLTRIPIAIHLPGFVAGLQSPPQFQGALPWPHRFPIRVEDGDARLCHHAPRVRLVRPLHQGAGAEAACGDGVAVTGADHGVRTRRVAGERAEVQCVVRPTYVQSANRLASRR